MPVLLPGKFHGQRSLEGYSSWGHKESDTTERLSMYLEMKREREGRRGRKGTKNKGGKEGLARRKEGRKEKYVGKRNPKPGEQWYMVI